MSLPQLAFTINSDKPIETQASPWKPLHSLNMQGSGYVKIIAIYYKPEEEEDAPTDTTSVVPAYNRVIRIPRETNSFSHYLRPFLSTTVVDSSLAALAANIINSHQERLININIIGWVDYHRIYENNVRFEQWGRLTPRRVNQPAIISIGNIERATEEAPIILAIENHNERAIEEAPTAQQPLTPEQVWQNIKEDDFHRRRLHDLYKIQDEMDDWSVQAMELLNIDRSNWTKNDRWRYNRFVVRPVSEKWERAAKKYYDCLDSLPMYLKKRVVNRKSTADIQPPYFYK